MKISYLKLKPGGVKFSKSHFPEIWPSAEAEGAAIDYACRSTQIFFPRNLSEDYLDFCRNVCLRNCNLQDFHCYEHNLECLDVERSKSLFRQGNVLRHSREKYVAGNMNHG